LVELEELLAEAKQLNLTRVVRYMQIRLKFLYEVYGFSDRLVKTIEALEKYPQSDPIKPEETLSAFHATAGRADLLMMDKKYDQAHTLYLKARDIVRPRYFTFHDTWLDIYALQRLAKLESERNRPNQASAYLDSAYVLAKDSKMHHDLLFILEKRVEIAEGEKRFSDALNYTREINKQQAIIDSTSKGFDEQRYQLELIRKQLVTENENQAFQLRLKENQMRSFFITGTLFLLLVVGLFAGLYKLRKDKKALAAKNILIQQQTEELKQLDIAKSRFFENVSHELRTPLTLILGPLKTLLEGNQPPEKQTQLLKMAMQSGKQLQELVKEILDLRKLEMSKMELYPKPTNLAVFFKQYTAQFESLADSKQIDFSYHTDLQNSVSAIIDREKCRQILHNLLSNAFKFSPVKGSVKVALSLENNLLILEVTDTGAGIHADDLPYVFDRFFQTTRPAEPAQGGTGIGLALCNEYVQLFGGKMEVESTLAIGSVFRASFPVTLSESTLEEVEFVENTIGFHPKAKTSKLLSSKPSDNFRRTILVVEDNPDLQAYVKLILKDKYQVITAGNGKEALDLFKIKKEGEKHDIAASFKPDLILSDLMMPIMDGYQLLEKLKSNDATRHIPVVMLTARAELKDKLKALRIGVDDYVVKPFEEEELMVRIENLLRNQTTRSTVAAAEVVLTQAVSLLTQEDQKWLEAFEGFVQKNLSNDFISVPFLAKQFTMSESTLLRKLKRLIGLTPIQYLTEIRLEKAKQLIENRTYNSIAKVAYQIGYADVNSFSRAFKRRYGKQPSLYNGE